jgi:hypothetical protein
VRPGQRFRILAALLPLACGCGYTLQGSHNPLGEREGVRRIYVAPLVNNTYTAGAENVVYNALIRTLSAGRRVTLVSRPEDADAVLAGSVDIADYVAAARDQARNLKPSGAAGTRYGDLLVPTLYNANLRVAFRLERREAREGRAKGTLWSADFARSKPFPASNQLGTPGTTSTLINDSEFDRALGEIAQSMTSDVHESMLAMF